MPVYEYRCGSGHHYEKTEGFDAPREQSCPRCGTPARRQISLPTVIFKGSGFYSTDNRKSSGGNGKSSETAPASASSDGQDGGSHSQGSDGGSHSQGSDSGSKAEAAASD